MRGVFLAGGSILLISLMQQSEIKQRSNPFRTPWRCADVVTVLTVRTENVLSSVVAV